MNATVTLPCPDARSKIFGGQLREVSGPLLAVNLQHEFIFLTDKHLQEKLCPLGVVTPHPYQVHFGYINGYRVRACQIPNIGDVGRGVSVEAIFSQKGQTET